MKSRIGAFVAGSLILSFSPPALSGQAVDAQGARYFFYLSDQRIVTVELSGRQRAILNYINLGESIEVLQSPMLAVIDRDGHRYNGHLFEAEGSDNPSDRYFVTDLLRPRQFKGYTLLGNFDFQAPPEKVYFRVGGRILEMASLDKREFDLVASRIPQIDLATPDTKHAILRAGFRSGFGELYFAGTEAAAPLESFFPDLKLIAPLLVEMMAPLLPPSFRHLPDPVAVRVSVSVSRSGGIFNPEVIQGIDPDLDRLAVESVRNSWRFLPAISEGSIADSQVTLNVVFERERSR